MQKTVYKVKIIANVPEESDIGFKQKNFAGFGDSREEAVEDAYHNAMKELGVEVVNTATTTLMV